MSVQPLFFCRLKLSPAASMPFPVQGSAFCSVIFLSFVLLRVIIEFYLKPTCLWFLVIQWPAKRGGSLWSSKNVTLPLLVTEAGCVITFSHLMAVEKLALRSLCPCSRWWWRAILMKASLKLLPATCIFFSLEQFRSTSSNFMCLR